MGNIRYEGLSSEPGFIQRSDSLHCGRSLHRPQLDSSALPVWAASPTIDSEHHQGLYPIGCGEPISTLRHEGDILIRFPMVSQLVLFSKVAAPLLPDASDDV
ncbi:unnamed protein product [Pleuronectes platessa]|uniref:Uncharacterized protein n=1 Tax=Pleuronectes platessa TaxID=8262 RepID=A0A9N7V897_PLEPL|nr:unnamed protein product [Pleuronectes platessa]